MSATAAALLSLLLLLLHRNGGQQVLLLRPSLLPLRPLLVLLPVPVRVVAGTRVAMELP